MSEKKEEGTKTTYWLIGFAAAACLLFLVLFEDALPPDVSGPRDITGLVRDPSGTPVSDFTLLIQDPADRTTIKTITPFNEQGRFAFILNDGEYTLICRAPGFTTYREPLSILPSAPAVTLTIVLKRL